MLKLLEKAVKKSIIRIIDLELAKILSPEEENIILLISAFLSYFNSIGNTCLPISIFKKNLLLPKKEIYLKKKIFQKICHIKNWNQELLKYDVFSDGKIKKPLILYNNYIYFYNNWKIEKKIVYFIQKCNINKINCIIKIKNIIQNIKEKISKQHKIAISLMIIKKNTFIIGGPGTGKTHLIKYIIHIFTKIYGINFKIKIAAFTGKATNNIIEILKNNIIYKKKIINNTIQISTIHNLLGIKKENKEPFFCKKNILSTDMIIIDETSMLNIFIMNKLVNAVSKKTKIIFLGDVFQLPSIDGGSLLKDICYYAKNKYSNTITELIKKITNYHVEKTNHQHNYINDCIYILKKKYRFHKKSDINIISQSILENNIKIFNKIIQNQCKNIIFMNINTLKDYETMIEIVTLQYIKYLKNFLKNKNKNNIINLIYKYKLLCIVKKGIFGVKYINKKIEKKIFKYIKLKKYYINNDNWYIGRPIIITKNNKILNIFNGEIGITTKNKNNKIQISFLSENQNIKNIPINLIFKKTYDIAWSITVHKSQGSEFKNIGLILPNKNHDLLNKEILYTAITRAKNQVNIFSKKKILLQTFHKKNIKYSGIKKIILKKNFNL